MKPLPDSILELTKLALSDLEQVEADDRYTVYMPVWHEPDEDTGTCYVCLAGAVIAQTLGGDIHRDINPEFYPRTTYQKLCFLDDMRYGRIRFTKDLKFQSHTDPAFRSVSRKVALYENDPEQFKTDMLEFATYLEDNGYKFSEN